MAKAIIWEFDGVDRAMYDAVNECLGLNPATGQGDWPDGLLAHSGATKQGGLVVFEVWESQEAQERWMTDRLGPALQDVGVPGPPTRQEWLDVAGFYSPR